MAVRTASDGVGAAPDAPRADRCPGRRSRRGGLDRGCRGVRGGRGGDVAVPGGLRADPPQRGGRRKSARACLGTARPRTDRGRPGGARHGWTFRSPGHPCPRPPRLSRRAARGAGPWSERWTLAGRRCASRSGGARPTRRPRRDRQGALASLGGPPAGGHRGPGRGRRADRRRVGPGWSGRHVVGPGQSVDDAGRAAGPPPHRPPHRGAGRRRPARRHPDRTRPRLGRGLEQGPVPRGRVRDRSGRAGAGLSAWWVREDGTVELSPAARPRTAWLARGV